jgi:prephenate dehydrogenase
MIDSVAVIGLGLMGGSLARDLAARGVRVFGFDRDPHSLQLALTENVIASALADDFSGIEKAQAVVLAVPVKAAHRVLEKCAPRVEQATLITDVGSVKREIQSTAAKLGLGDRFVGAHPFTGDHRAGWSASQIGLYQDARVFLCPSEGTRPDALALAEELWRAVGAAPVVTSAGEHDQRIAWTSHLPQVTATAVAHALEKHGILPDDLGPGGRSVTRLAGSDAEMWTDIAMENSAAIDTAIAEIEKQLSSARAAIRSGDASAVRAFFSDGAGWAARAAVTV